MPLIDFLRHGETTRPGALLGRTDVPMSERGFTQIASQTAGRAWDRIVASPLQRARAGAERVAETLSVPLTLDPDWAEIHLGDWDGNDLAALRADPVIALQLMAYYKDPTTLAAPNGESYSDVATRVARALDRLLDAPENAQILVVAHAGSIRTALALAAGISLDKLWALRVDFATRIRVHLGRDPRHGLWAEIQELSQPVPEPAPYPAPAEHPRA